MVAGSALVCGYLSVVVAGKENLAVVFGAAVAAGIAAGVGLGRLLLGLYEGRVTRAASRRRRADLAIVLLTVPAYVAAGWTSAVVGWAVAVALSGRIPAPGLPNVALLIGAALVIYPISYAFARRDPGRPDDLAGSVRTMHDELYDRPRSFAVLGEAMIGLAWLIGSLLAIFALVIGIQVVLGPRLDGLPMDGPLPLVVFLVVWIGGTAAGTVWTVRRLDRRRRRRR